MSKGIQLRAAVCTGLLLIAGAAAAQDDRIRDEVFSDTDAVRNAAQQADTELFAPASHAEAARYYEDAEESFERGRDIDRIQRDLAEATTHFNTALKTTELAKLTLSDAITARAAAEEAEAYRDAERTWGDAEETFGRAIEQLEDGDLDRARRFGDEATQLYTRARAESNGN